jgi:uncharacterized membrane protein YdjX (TVP38/TMEM64 family)
LIVAAWAFTPLSELSDVDAVLAKLREWSVQWWAPLGLVGLYVISALVAFPLTVLIAATGMIYGVWLGLAIALLAGLIAATVGFAIGHVLAHSLIRRMTGGPVERISAALGRHGVVTVGVLRITPVASFAAINYLAGASHVRYRDFVAGTLIGGAPYALAICLFGDVLEQTLRDPSWSKAGLLAAAFLAVLMVAIGANWVVNRWRAAKGAIDQNGISSSRSPGPGAPPPPDGPPPDEPP